MLGVKLVKPPPVTCDSSVFFHQVRLHQALLVVPHRDVTLKLKQVSIQNKLAISIGTYLVNECHLVTLLSNPC